MTESQRKAALDADVQEALHFLLDSSRPYTSAYFSEQSKNRVRIIERHIAELTDALAAEREEKLDWNTRAMNLAQELSAEQSNVYHLDNMLATEKAAHEQTKLAWALSIG